MMRRQRLCDGHLCVRGGRVNFGALDLRLSTAAHDARRRNWHWLSLLASMSPWLPATSVRRRRAGEPPRVRRLLGLLHVPVTLSVRPPSQACEPATRIQTDSRVVTHG